MNENSKVSEAEFFHGQILTATTEREYINYFSALTTAARSVIQYAYAEFNGPPKDQAKVDWLNDKIAKNPALKLLWDI